MAGTPTAVIASESIGASITANALARAHGGANGGPQTPRRSGLNRVEPFGIAAKELVPFVVCERGGDFVERAV
jgi:hypothetical protein